MSENQFFVDSEKLSEKALEKKHRLENDPSSRADHMAYLPGMEQIRSDVMEKVISQMNSYDAVSYTARDVQAALQRWFVVLFTHISNVLYFNSFYALFQQVGPQTTGAFNGHVVAPFVNFCLMPRQ